MKKIILLLSIVLYGVSVLFASVIKETEEFYQLLESGQFDEVSEKIKSVEGEGLKHFWQSRVYFYSGDYKSAYKEITYAVNYDEAEPWWNNLKDYYNYIDALTKDFMEFSSDHFRFRASGQNIILASYALDALEKAYEQLGIQLECVPQRKVVVEVYPDKKSFSAASTLSEEILEKTGTVGICKFNRLMILSPQDLPLGYSWLDTLSHEYVHFLVNQLSSTKCPLWLHEGIARYHESLWRTKEPEYLTSSGEHKLKEAQDKNSFISFKRMSPSLVYLDTQDEIMLAFAQVSVAVDFMKKSFTSGVIPRLLKNLAQYPEKKAFKKTLHVSKGMFEKNWLKYVKSLELTASPGAVVDEVLFTEKSEDEFIGADAKGHIRLGNRMRQIKRFDAAVVHYNKALTEEPANPVILLKLARSLIELEKIDEAEEKLKLAIEKNPHYITPYQALGKLYFERGQYDKSIEVYSKAVSINPFHPDTHHKLSRCYIITKQPGKALRELRATLLLDPSDMETKVIFERMKNNQ